MTRQRGAPSASAASRSEFGTSVEDDLGRARDDRQHEQRERDRALPAGERAADASSSDEDDVDEEAEDDRRHAGHHVDEVAHDVREARVLPYSTRYSATPMPSGTAMALASATISIVPRMAERMPPGIAEEAAGRVGREEVDAPRAEALLDQVVEDEHERHERDQREGEHDAAHDRGRCARRRALTARDRRATALIPPSPSGRVRGPRRRG